MTNHPIHQPIERARSGAGAASEIQKDALRLEAEALQPSCIFALPSNSTLAIETRLIMPIPHAPLHPFAVVLSAPAILATVSPWRRRPLGNAPHDSPDDYAYA